MKVTLRGRTYDSADEPILITLSADDKEAVNGMGQSEDQIFIYPDHWSAQEVRQQLNAFNAPSPPPAAVSPETQNSDGDIIRMLGGSAPGGEQAPPATPEAPGAELSDGDIVKFLSPATGRRQFAETVIEGRFAVAGNDQRTSQ